MCFPSPNPHDTEEMRNLLNRDRPGMGQAILIFRSGEHLIAAPSHFALCADIVLQNNSHILRMNPASLSQTAWMLPG